MTDERRQKLYSEMEEELSFHLLEEKNPIGNMGIFLSILHYTLPHLTWSGSYYLKNNSLYLGPFQGIASPAILDLKNSLVGYCFRSNEIILVPDEENRPEVRLSSSFPSELLVPFYKQQQAKGVIHLLKPEKNSFEKSDGYWISKMLVEFERFI